MEYIAIDSNELVNGKASFSTDVFVDITETALKKTKDVTAAKKDPIDVSYKDKKLSVSIAIRVLLGTNVVKICEALQTRVHDNILEMTGIDCQDISLDIAGFFTKEKEKAKEQ
ncbi:MAG: Asp23/Gls24 family envelope stress response protein [Erysipelotrichaceae bacterium]|nr:Asp23/Gls24 family envelope stress response protein [Erysipelotrichaceae bacterium]MBR2551485.1 Asp23/Gls24 family envelope stress response protein [Erysipelotrichaceae bacterium]MBR4121893.1 Asp23/Gls24 family envelope stress response protein [Erysipelotrichaceae bacterium]